MLHILQSLCTVAATDQNKFAQCFEETQNADASITSRAHIHAPTRARPCALKIKPQLQRTYWSYNESMTSSAIFVFRQQNQSSLSIYLTIYLSNVSTNYLYISMYIYVCVCVYLCIYLCIYVCARANGETVGGLGSRYSKKKKSRLVPTQQT